MRVSWCTGIAAIAFGFPTLGWSQQAATSGQDVFSTTAREALRRSAETWSSRGFSLQGSPHIGVLSERERDSLVVPAERDRQYVIAGMCDEDCGVLDFFVFDAADSLVGSYTQSDGHPYVQLLRSDSTAYRLEVVMTRCSAPPCYYGVQVLVRRAPPPKN